jgi:hypothetical protein
LRPVKWFFIDGEQDGLGVGLAQLAQRVEHQLLVVPLGLDPPVLSQELGNLTT